MNLCSHNNLALYLFVIWVGSCRPGSSSKISLSSSLRSVTSASCSMILKASVILRNVEKSRSLFGVVTRTVSVMKTLEVLSSFWTSTQGMISFTDIRGKRQKWVGNSTYIFQIWEIGKLGMKCKHFGRGERTIFADKVQAKAEMPVTTLHPFSLTSKGCLFQNLSLKILLPFIWSAGLGSSAFAEYLPYTVL